VSITRALILDMVQSFFFVSSIEEKKMQTCLNYFSESVEQLKTSFFNYEPYPVFFSGELCSGTMFPSNPAELPVFGECTNVKDFTFNSFYVPYQLDVGAYEEIDCYNGGPATYKLEGQNFGSNKSRTIKSLKINYKDPTKNWNIYRKDLCLNGNNKEYIGPYPINVSKLDCDTFMQGEYCVGDGLDEKECSCIKEQALLDKQYKDLNVSAICFNNDCAQYGYKTANMLNNKCSVPIGSTINNVATGDVINEPIQTLHLNEDWKVRENNLDDILGTTTEETKKEGGYDLWVLIVMGILAFVIGAIFLLLIAYLKK